MSFSPILGWNAYGFRSRHALIARSRSTSWSRLLAQLQQLHPLQNSPLAKQSQYLYTCSATDNCHEFIHFTNVPYGTPLTCHFGHKPFVAINCLIFIIIIIIKFLSIYLFICSITNQSKDNQGYLAELARVTHIQSSLFAQAKHMWQPGFPRS